MQVRKNVVAGRVGVSAVAVLFLSGAAGCSSDSGQKPAAAAGTHSSSPSAPSTPSATVPATSATSTASSPTSAGPTFTFPVDYHLTVDPDTTGDPVKDAILTDNARFLEADQEALASGNANDPLLLRYAMPDSLPQPVAAMYVCDDQSKLHAPTGGNHVLYVYGMAKAANGTWQAVISTPDQDVQQVKQQCQ